MRTGGREGPGPGSTGSAVAARWLPEPRGGGRVAPSAGVGSAASSTGTQDQAETVGSPRRCSGQWSGAGDTKHHVADLGRRERVPSQSESAGHEARSRGT